MNEKNWFCPRCGRDRRKPYDENGEMVPCCNPACGGTWGTGCYCCHHPKYLEEENTMLFQHPGKVKYAYFRDPLEPRRVLSIGYELYKPGSHTDEVLPYRPDAEGVWFTFTINKVVDPVPELDPRLRALMPRAEFRELRKKYRKRYGGDLFSKKAARSILARRSSRAMWLRLTEEKVLIQILKCIADPMREAGEWKMGGVIARNLLRAGVVYPVKPTLTCS